MSAAAPLILTLSLDEHAFSFFNALRKKHFPPERNYLQAHLTLFHHLPAEEPSIIETIRKTTAQQAVLPLPVSGTAFIGNGVAYKIESSHLVRLHVSLQEAWKQWLIPQDRKKLWPHITVQNKVAPSIARALHQQLSSEFTPFTAYGTGLSVWVYEGGPWTFLNAYPFARE